MTHEEKRFPSVSLLEQSLGAIVLPKANFFDKRKPSPPTPRHKDCAHFSDLSQQCAAQIAAVQNNIDLLSSAVFGMATKPVGALSPELATDTRKLR